MLSEKLETEVKGVEFKNKEESISESKHFPKKEKEPETPTTQEPISLNKSLKISLSKGDDKTCKLCMEKKLDSVFFPCGHLTSCFLCSIKVIISSGVCPLCRASIQEIMRIEEEVGMPDVCKVMECVDFANIIYYTKLLQ